MNDLNQFDQINSNIYNSMESDCGENKISFRDICLWSCKNFEDTFVIWWFNICANFLVGRLKNQLPISNHISLTTDRSKRTVIKCGRWSLATANKTDKAPKSKVQSGVTESELRSARVCMIPCLNTTFQCVYHKSFIPKQLIYYTSNTTA